MYFEGHKQNPSWCFAVSITSDMPASAAVLTHWLASSRAGLKMAGLSRPVPHSESVKVFTPKWRNIMSSLCCHLSWEYVGSGRMGNGGVGTCSSLEMVNVNSWKNVITRHKEYHCLAIMPYVFSAIYYVANNYI